MSSKITPPKSFCDVNSGWGESQVMFSKTGRLKQRKGFCEERNNEGRLSGRPNLVASVGSREGVLKQRDLRRCESKYNKQRTDQTDRGEGKLWVFTWKPILFECPPFKEKNQCCRDIKDGDVDPIRGFAEYAIIGVKQHWDKCKSQQNLSQLDAPIVFLLPEENPLNESKEKQWPEQQLHMLPGGLVHPGKGRNQNAPTCPIVQEMQNRSGECTERKSCCLPKN